jgi:signal transduction histidine kinase
VVDHLLSNAVEFTEAGGTVSVGASLEAHGRLLLVVRHTGIGIAEEGTECVFEPFTQLDSTLAGAFQGAGLGSTCRVLRWPAMAPSCRCTARQALGHPWRFACRPNG